MEPAMDAKLQFRARHLCASSYFLGMGQSFIASSFWTTTRSFLHGERFPVPALSTFGTNAGAAPSAV
ncbi:hypothetical protein AKJ16_DCAP14738 [Drosera capensis]